MPPQAQAPGAIPIVLHAELHGLLTRHEVELATVFGAEPGEQEAIAELKSNGLRVYSTRRHPEHGWGAWQRRWRMGMAWLSRKYPWRTIWYWEPGLQQILDRVFSEQTYDLVIVEDNSMGVYTYQTKSPILFTEHEARLPRPVAWSDLRTEHPIRWALNEWNWIAWRRYQVVAWRRFDRIQAFTQRDADRICKLAPDLVDRVRVNPFGIDLPEEADPARQVEGTILFVGNFTHAPNVDAALWLGREIMPLLRKQYPGASLTLVGIYPPAEVRNLACEDIQVTGPVAQIEPYLQKAALVIAPLRIGGGMRMKVLHSMGMGKAIVTTSRGAEGLALSSETPPLAIAEDAQGIAAAAANLLSSPVHRYELGRQARLYVARHFSAQAYADRIEAIFTELKTGPEKERA
jgi:glycosyltransferase involved in cell wall biosynthesis